jgi:hypothetical protein
MREFGELEIVLLTACRIALRHLYFKRRRQCVTTRRRVGCLDESDSQGRSRQ